MPPVIAAAVNCIVIRKSLSRTALSLLRSEQKASHASRISRIDLGHLSFLPRFQLRQLLRELRSAFAVLGGMFICLLVLMIALDCYVYCDNFNRRSILETTYEYCYTYKYPTEEVPEGGTPAYAETLRQTSYGYDLDVTMLGIDPGCPYFPEVAPTAKKSEVVIASSVAQKFGVGKGDVLVLRDEVNDVNYAFTVTDVVHYASGLYIFMDRDAMQELFGRSDDYYNTVFADHALDIDTGLLYATVSRQNIEQTSAVFTDLMMPMVIMVSVLSVIIFLVVLYLMIKVMIDRASYSISLLKVFGYCTGEVRRLYLDGNFVVAALGALVCIPAAKGLMDVIYPYFVSNVAAGLELSFPPQLYAVIYAGVLACYLLIDLVLVRRLDRMTPCRSAQEPGVTLPHTKRPPQPPETDETAEVFVLFVLQVQQHIHPEHMVLGLDVQAAAVFVHCRLDGHQPDAHALVLGGVQNAALLFQHTVVVVLHHNAQHGGAQHPGHHPHLPLLGRQPLAGVQGVLQQIAQHRAQVGFRQRQLAGQLQLPLDGRCCCFASLS